MTEQEKRKEDMDFLTDVIFKIIDYAKAHNMEPDDTIQRTAQNMLDLLTIATFNGGEEE